MFAHGSAINEARALIDATELAKRRIDHRRDHLNAAASIAIDRLTSALAVFRGAHGKATPRARSG